MSGGYQHSHNGIRLNFITQRWKRVASTHQFINADLPRRKRLGEASLGAFVRGGQSIAHIRTQPGRVLTDPPLGRMLSAHQKVRDRRLALPAYQPIDPTKLADSGGSDGGQRAGGADQTRQTAADRRPSHKFCFSINVSERVDWLISGLAL